MAEPDDRELQQFLSGQGDLSALYRATSRESPPAELDQAILAHARAHAGRGPGAGRWLAPLGLAVTALIGANLAWNVYEHAPQPAPAPAPVAALPKPVRELSAPGAPEAVAPAEGPSRAEASAPAATPAPATAADPLAEAAAGVSRNPHGWWLGGEAPEDYRVGLNDRSPRSGAHSLMIASVDAPVIGAVSSPPRAAGALTHAISASEYRGHHVMFEAWVRTAGVQRGAGLWMRVDDEQGTQLRFENMSDRPIRGDQAWQPYRIIMDIPAEAARISFGLVLDGTGEACVDDARIEAIARVAGESADASAEEPAAPATLSYDFEGSAQ